MNRQELIEQIRLKKSFLCVGLDTDTKKIPPHLLKDEDPIFAFNKAIIDATSPYCVSYKPNLAFYEAFGVKGMVSFEKTIKYLKENYPKHFIIADAKRGDIGNTSDMYARTFFEEYDIDALTVAPYMGEDCVTPFLKYENKWVILLALTSNKGSHDFQLMEDKNGQRLFEKVLQKSQNWGNDENMMFVVGATQGEMFRDIRKIAPNLHSLHANSASISFCSSFAFWAAISAKSSPVEAYIIPRLLFTRSPQSLFIPYLQTSCKLPP